MDLPANKSIDFASLTLEAASDAEAAFLALGEEERERAAFLDNRKLDSDRSRM
jgi:hypothetical protein